MNRTKFRAAGCLNAHFASEPGVLGLCAPAEAQQYYVGYTTQYYNLTTFQRGAGCIIGTNIPAVTYVATTVSGYVFYLDLYDSSKTTILASTDGLVQTTVTTTTDSKYRFVVGTCSLLLGVNAKVGSVNLFSIGELFNLNVALNVGSMDPRPRTHRGLPKIVLISVFSMRRIVLMDLKSRNGIQRGVY